MDNNRAIALGFGERRFRTLPWPAAWLVGAHAGGVCGEGGSRLEGGPSGRAEEGEERFNLADGGTGTLRASHTVRHAHT